MAGQWEVEVHRRTLPAQLPVYALLVKLRRLPAPQVAHRPPSRPPARASPGLVPRAMPFRSSGSTPAWREVAASPRRTSLPFLTDIPRSRIACEPLYDSFTMSSQITPVCRLSARIQSACWNVNRFSSRSWSPCPQQRDSPFRPPQAPNGGQQIRT